MVRSAARVEVQARRAADRTIYRPLLDPRAVGAASVDAVAQGWVAARRWPGNPEADLAAEAGARRLRQLDPDRMAHAERRIAAGASPADAARDAGLLQARGGVSGGRPTPERNREERSDAAGQARPSPLVVPVVEGQVVGLAHAGRQAGQPGSAWARAASQAAADAGQQVVAGTQVAAATRAAGARP
jgi:hypothetical protein